MSLRTKLLLVFVLTSAVCAVVWSTKSAGYDWIHFGILMTAILASSGLKVILPQGEGMMSLNFPFILLAIVQLSPGQAILLAASSVLVQCKFRVIKLFTTLQILFNVSNAINSTACAYLTFVFFSRRGLTMAPALSLAACVYFLLSTICVALVIAWSKRESPWLLWKTQFPWYLPFYLVGAGLATVADVIGHKYGWLTSMLMIPVVYILYRSYMAQMVRIKERQQHLEETEALHLRTIEGLAMAIEAKDRNTHEHLFRVRRYAAEMGRSFQLSKLELQALQTAAFLHDIGKLAVPEHIINKPGKLSPEEFEKMKIHPVVGADILERVRFPYPVVPVVRSHHEWWDGSGYPDGLKGAEIPIGARILSAVDCFDALASDRPYRKGLPIAEALVILKRMAGVQFDPEVVRVLEEYFLTSHLPRPEEMERPFQPLDTNIDVWRGEAPAAGLAQPLAAARERGWTEDAGEQSDSEAAQSVESRHLLAAARHQAQALFEIGQSLGDSLSLHETVSVIASRLHTLMPFQCCALYKVSGYGLTLEFIEGHGSRCFTQGTIPLGEGISGWVALSGNPMLNANAEMELNYHCRNDEPDRLRAALSIPLFDLQHEVFGVLSLFAYKADSFSRDDLRTLQVMETKLSLALQRTLRLREPATDRQTDSLTGLPNAHQLFFQLETELDRCRHTGGELALIVCDLHAFQEINQRHGHLAGDAILRAIADQFRQSGGDFETVARMGGDEFAFLLPRPESEDLATRLRQIANGIEAGFREAGFGAGAPAHVGVALYPADAATAEDLLAQAERRMYLEKSLASGSHEAVESRATAASPGRALA